MADRSLTRRRWLQQAAGGTALLVLGPAQLAWGAQLVAVRLWPADAYTRVTLESDTALEATFFSVEGPSRLVIDIEGLELSPQIKELVRKVRTDDPFIAGVRVGQYRPKVVRLVIDLKQAIKPQVFGLAPVAAYQHRLVFDLYPKHPVDPRVALHAAANHPESEGALNKAAPGGASNAASASAGAASDAASPGVNAIAQGKASDQAAESVNDALGEFIGKLPGKPPSASDRVAQAPAAAARPPLAGPERGGERPREPVDKAPRPAAQRLIIVAIDAGHGGEDPGAIGPSGLYEKDVVLSIAQKLRARINAQPGMRAMLTRESDYFVPLNERVHKARRVQADLFVSIHADAFMNPQARGASIFALSDRGATSAAARWMAKRENASDMVGGVNIKAKDSSVMRAMLDMSTTAQIKDSLKLGQAVLAQLGKVGKLHKPRVEQAGFAVLKAPDIPSILVETGFISNPEEESKLRDDGYQAKLADALMSGIKRYFERNPPLARNRSL